MKRSFRRRLALGAVVLAGTALVGFALLSSWLIRRAKVERLDAQMQAALVRAARPRREGGQNLEQALARELNLRRATDVAVWVDGPGGSYRSPHWPELAPRTAPPRRGRPPRPYTEAGWRVLAVGLPQRQVTLAVSLHSLRHEMAAIRRAYLLGIPAVLGAIAAGAWGLAGRTLAPVRQLSDRIAHITARGLDQRVSTQGSDAEFAPLIAAFNQMLERLERSFHQASRFSGDAAHELKTPLAILQGQLEQAIQQASDPQNQRTYTELLEEVSHLNAIVAKLLLLSQADAGQLGLQRQPVDFTALVQELVEDWDWLAPGLRLELAVAEGLEVSCDRTLTLQLLQNLLSNAIKYNASPGWVRIQAEQNARQLRCTVTNSAAPLSDAERQHLFDRFYRGDPARTRRDGLGLGLSLAREIARAHGGELRLLDSAANTVSLGLTLPR